MDTMITMGLLLLAGHSAAKEGAQSIDMDAMVPTFDSPMANVTVKEGATAVLPCSVKFLGKRKVVWLDQWSTLLTFGDRRVIDDERVSVERPFAEDWNLHIRDVQHRDQDLYKCQVNTSPVMTKTVHLTVQACRTCSDQKCSNNCKDGGPWDRCSGTWPAVDMPASTATTEMTHTCSVTGDPHLHTFQGDKVLVPGPCSYTMVKLRNYQRSDTNLALAFLMIVEASNELVAETGQYYVSDVRVQVWIFSIIDGRHIDHRHGIYTTSSEMKQAFIQMGSPSDESVWGVNGVLMSEAVSPSYDADHGLANLLVVIPDSGETVNLTFRPIDRQRAAAGRHQVKTAGLTIEVKGDLIPDDFPSSLCSTTSDLARTPKEYALAMNITEHSVGIFATLIDQHTDQTSSSHKQECYDLLFRPCGDKYMAVQMCSPLQTEPAMVSCLETNTSSFRAFDLCMRWMCSRNTSSCAELQSYVDGCPGHLAPLNCVTLNSGNF